MSSFGRIVQVVVHLRGEVRRQVEFLCEFEQVIEDAWSGRWVLVKRWFFDRDAVARVGVRSTGSSGRKTSPSKTTFRTRVMVVFLPAML